MAVVAMDQWPHPFYEGGHAGDGSTDYKIKGRHVREGFGPSPNTLNIAEPQRIGDRCGHLYFLSNRVAEDKPRIWKENGQRNSRESTPCAHVEDARTRLRSEDPCNGEAVQHMTREEMVHVLS